MNLPAWITNNAVLIAILAGIAFFFPSLLGNAIIFAAGLWVGWNALKQPAWAAAIWDKMFGGDTT